MTQTRERRIYLAWKGEKRRHDYRNGETHSPAMKVARRFRVPIRVVRDAIEAQREVA
ncbi:hypothetical protein ACFYWD_21345 [Streptomyces sp. NPDC003781]|uniref:hypothetical protein n=1 Tax=Streptomyces sp. NPDC003781 TaxID=3364686 RepID=UPI00369DBDD0